MVKLYYMKGVHRIKKIMMIIIIIIIMIIIIIITKIIKKASVRRCFTKKLFLKVLQKFTGKHLCWDHFLIKLQA